MAVTRPRTQSRPYQPIGTSAVSDGAAVLLPSARFPALLWLIIADFALPKTRARAATRKPARPAPRRTACQYRGASDSP